MARAAREALQNLLQQANAAARICNAAGFPIAWPFPGGFLQPAEGVKS